MMVARQLLRACANVLAHPWPYPRIVFVREGDGLKISADVLAILRSSVRTGPRSYVEHEHPAGDEWVCPQCGARFKSSAGTGGNGWSPPEPGAPPPSGECPGCLALTDAEADALVSSVLAALTETVRERTPIALAILAAEGPLLDWWCAEISRRMSAG